jgi:hypothetical protein
MDITLVGSHTAPILWCSMSQLILPLCPLPASASFLPCADSCSRSPMIIIPWLSLCHLLLNDSSLRAATLTDSREPTPQEASKLGFLAGITSVCIGIMHSWCMPATRSSDRPQDAKYEYDRVRMDMRRHHSQWSKCAWTAPVFLSKCVPSNAYICSRLLARRAAECDPFAPAFWEVRPCRKTASTVTYVRQFDLSKRFHLTS